MPTKSTDIPDGQSAAHIDSGMDAMGSVRLSSKGNAARERRAPSSTTSSSKRRSRADRIQSASEAKGTQSEPCPYLCNKYTTDPDEVDPSKPMRWTYGGAGANDWYCERVYQGKHAHKMTREELQRAIRKDKQVLDAFQADRATFVESKKNGVRCVSWGTGHKKTVSTERDRSCRLIKPKDKFWPLDLYRAQYGDPNFKQNRKKNHMMTLMKT